MDIKKEISLYTLLIIIVIVAITLPISGVFLYNYWKGFIEEQNGYNSINAVIAYASGVINIIAIFFLFINYVQQREQVKKQQIELNKNNKENEFNKIIQLVQNQLVFTREIIGERKKMDFHTLKQHDKLTYDLTLDFYYDHYEKIFKQHLLYKKYLTNRLTVEDNELIFLLISTNFLDDQIEELRLILSLYQEPNIDQIINGVVYGHYTEAYDDNKHNLGYNYSDEIHITKEMIDTEYAIYIKDDIRKLTSINNMLRDIISTYDQHRFHS